MKSRFVRRIGPLLLLALIGCNDRRQGDWDDNTFGFGVKTTTKTTVTRSTTTPSYPAQNMPFSVPPQGYPTTNPNPMHTPMGGYPPGTPYGDPSTMRTPMGGYVPPNTPSREPTAMMTPMGGYTPPNSPSGESKPWTVWRDKRNRYRAEFPAGQMRETTINQTVQGKNYRTFVDGVEDGDRAYVVLVTENVTEPKTREAIDALDLAFMKLAVTGARGQGGKFSKTLTALDGIPCSVLEFQNIAGTTWGKCLGFIVDDVAYQFVAVDRVGKRTEVQRFMDSFQLLGRDGNARTQPMIDPKPRLPIPVEGPFSKAEPTAVAPTEISEERPALRIPPLKPADNNFPSMNAPDRKLADPPPDVPQPEFKPLPSIPKIKTK